MIITKWKEFELLSKKSKIMFIYFYEDFCSDITNTIDTFFNNKYDLNKKYIKIKVNNSKKIIQLLDITTYPIIKVYKNNKSVGEIYCNNNNFNDNLEKLYHNIIS